MAPRLELSPVAVPEVLPVILYSTKRLSTENLISLIIVTEQRIHQSINTLAVYLQR
jgi:hypothetical protein